MRKSFALIGLQIGPLTLTVALLLSRGAVAQSSTADEVSPSSASFEFHAPSVLLTASASVPDGGVPRSYPDNSAHGPRITETGMVRSMIVTRRATSRTCASGEASAKSCRERWQPLLRQSFELLAVQAGTRLTFDQQARDNTFSGHWLSHYLDAAGNADLTRWSNGDSSASNYAKLPVMGATTAFLFIQNDPKGRDLGFQNSRQYWMSRLRATAFSAAYEAEWTLGPISSASLGNFSNGSPPRGAGAMDFVMMPLGGAAWSIGEDVIDRQIIWRLEGKTNNRAALLALSALNPSRSVANLLRAKAPWYRDSRETRTPMSELPFASFRK